MNNVKTKNNKGFTLAEMLIVVAIIGILISITTIAISSFLEKAREATDLANIRNACSEMQTYLIDETYDKTKFEVYTTTDGTKTRYMKTYVNCVSKTSGWQTKSIELNNKGYAIMCGGTLIAPSPTKPVVRIRLNLDTGTYDFNPEAADTQNKRIGVYNR